MPVFNERGLVPLKPSRPPGSPVPVSSGDDPKEEEDPKKTPEEVGETSPLSKAEILRALPDDAEADIHQREREQPPIPTRGRSSLVPRDAASALMLSGFRLLKRKYVMVD